MESSENNERNSQERHMSDNGNREELASEALKITLMSCMDCINGKKPPEAEMALTRCAVFVQRMLNEKSLPSRTLNAVRIVARIVSKTYEENTKRFYIEFVAAGGDPDKVEHVRSDRTDRSNGKLVRDLWEPVQPGDTCLIFRLNEPPSEKDKKDAPQGYRTAPYVEVMSKANAH